jgi:hypothetical protein
VLYEYKYTEYTQYIPKGNNEALFTVTQHIERHDKFVTDIKATCTPHGDSAVISVISVTITQLSTCKVYQTFLSASIFTMPANSFLFMMTTMRLLLLWSLFPFEDVSAACSMEFERCVMNRDCCEGYDCIVGDWEVTTDSTCLSDRSVQLNSLEMTKKVSLIQRYYDALGVAKKTPQDAEVLAKKYANKREFAQLVVRLERKYGIPVDYDKHSNGKEEL